MRMSAKTCADGIRSMTGRKTRSRASREAASAHARCAGRGPRRQGRPVARPVACGDGIKPVHCAPFPRASSSCRSGTEGLRTQKRIRKSDGSSKPMMTKPVDDAAAAAPAIELRFGQIGLMQVRIRSTDPGAILDELTGRVASAPLFFQRTGVCLDLTVLGREPEVAEMRAVMDAVRRAGMLPVGLV